MTHEYGEGGYGDSFYGGALELNASDIFSITDAKSSANMVFSTTATSIAKGIDTIIERITFSCNVEDIVKAIDSIIDNIWFLCTAIDMLKNVDAGSTIVDFLCTAAAVLKNTDLASWFELNYAKKIFKAVPKTLVFKAV
jgi:phage tail tube protein FII